MKLKSALTSLALVALISGCDTFLSTELHQEQICKTLPDQEFPGAPLGGTDVEQSFEDIDLSSVSELLDVDIERLELNFTSASLTVTSPGTDLNDIETAVISIDPPSGSSLQSVDLVEYLRDPDALPGQTLTAVPPEGPVNVLGFLQEGGGLIGVTVALEGAFPTDPWTADVEICADLLVRASYQDIVDLIGGLANLGNE